MALVIAEPEIEDPPHAEVDLVLYLVSGVDGWLPRLIHHQLVQPLVVRGSIRALEVRCNRYRELGRREEEEVGARLGLSAAVRHGETSVDRVDHPPHPIAGGPAVPVDHGSEHLVHVFLG